MLLYTNYIFNYCAEPIALVLDLIDILCIYYRHGLQFVHGARVGGWMSLGPGIFDSGVYKRVGIPQN